MDETPRLPPRIDDVPAAQASETSVRQQDTQVAGGSVLSARRHVVLGVLALGLVVAVGAIFVVQRGDDAPPPPKPNIALDAWAPYWALDDSLPEFAERVGAIRDVSPFWFNATGVDDITIDPNALDEGIDDFIAQARTSGANVVPSIIDSLPAGEMAAIISDPTLRTRHVAAIRAFADEGDFDGIDIDYEQFAFADGRASWETTRPMWVLFITELGAGLRADGRSLSVSIPPIYDAGRTADSGFWVYDYGAIAPHVDRIRIMAYDFSVEEPGPIAPLAFVERAINGALEATGDPNKLVLGLPAYGRNWPTGTAGECPESELQGRTAVTARSVDELIATRGATPIPVAATGEWMFEYDLEVTDGTTSCIQGRQVNYVDGDGIRQRMDLAREYQLNGVSLWALGFDDDAVWEAILPTVADAGAAAASVSPGTAP
jgi:hypothetical protein